MKNSRLDINKINCMFYSGGAQVNFYKNEYIELMPPEKVLFPKYIKRGHSVLDLGCGTGRTTSYIHTIAEKIIGTDISEAMIETAKGKFKDIDFRVMDASRLEFPDNTFDIVVFSFNGLCLLYPEELRIKSIKEIYRVLKKNGVFIFSSHNRYPPLTLSSIVNLIITKLFMGFSSKYKIHLTRCGISVNYETSPKEETALFQNMNFELLDIIPMTQKITFWGYKPAVLTYYAFKKF